ncbi:MAG TPA: M28 family peptidase, partial [Gemmatimonadales bacterium]
AAGIAVAGLDLLPPQLLAYYQEPFQQIRPDSSPVLPSFLYLRRRGAELLMGAPLDGLAPGTAGRPVGGELRFMDRPIEYPGRNVIAILRGSDPALRNEYVAIGAHNDHIGTEARPVAHDSIYIRNHLFRPGGADDPAPRLTPEQTAELNGAIAAVRARSKGASARPDSIDNGADDDGSGSMGVLELAEYFAGRPERPKRSLLFIWHVGEEEGLYGSEYFTDHPTVPRQAIVAQINVDMIGRGGSGDVTGNTLAGARIRGNADYLQLIGSRRLSTELGDLAEAVNRGEKSPLAFDYSMDANGHPQNIYCRSDHWNYARYGIPIVFVTTGGHADYHQVTDEPQYIDYDHTARVVSFLAELASDVANLGHRVVVDKPVPSAGAECRQ